MPHYFLKLIPRRPTFAQDMTDDETAVMQRHVVYWGNLMNQGMVAVYGPVFDPNGTYGIGVVETQNEQQLQELIQNDPASEINKYEYYLMRAITPAK
jgi:uncharacterized protein YciI